MILNSIKPMVQKKKAELRKQMLEQRNAIPEEERAERAVAIMKRLFSEPHFEQATTVALYMSIGSEVGTREMVRKATEMKKEVCLPVVADDHHIELYRFDSFDGLRKGRFGILEPGKRKPPSKEPDVIVLPGVAFGLCMHRLGYGKGYYDRLLARLPTYRIGICFDFQLVENLPKHEDDQRMHKIITEKREIA